MPDKKKKTFKAGMSPIGRADISKYVKPRNVDVNKIDFTQPLQAPDADQYKWMSEYIKSPKYRERLSGLYKSPDEIIKKRLAAVREASLNDGAMFGLSPGVNRLNEKAITLNNKGMKDLRMRRDEVLIHELAHLFNSKFDEHGMGLTPEEERYLFSKEKIIGNWMVGRNLGAVPFAKENKIPISVAVTQAWNAHDSAPNELKSDIDALRYLMHKQGIYDPGRQNITKEMLDKARSNWNISNSHMLNRLQKHYSDEDLIEIMNTVVRSAPNRRPQNDRSNRFSVFYGPTNDKA